MSDLETPSTSVLPASPPPTPSRRRLVIGGVVAGVVVVAIILAFLFWPKHGVDDSIVPAAGSSTPTSSPAASPTAPGATTQAGAVAGSLTPSAPASSAVASPAGTAKPTGSVAAKPPTSFSPPPHVSSVSTIGPQLATGLVAGRGIDIPGVVQQAVQWQDANGRNVLLGIERIDHNRADGGPDAGAIVVMLVANLDGKAKVLRTITDASGTVTKPCPTDFGMEVLPGSLTVRDDDHDGVGEATAAWWIACAGDVQRFPSRVALLSGGKKYLLSGQALPKVGSPSYTDADRKKMGLPAGTFGAGPGRGSWPANSYARATALFHRLFN